MTTYPMYDPTSLAASGDLQDRPVTIAAGSNAAGAVLKRGTVLGRVTATDKYVPSVKTANDGSQVPAAVTAVEVDASAADVAAPAYFDGEFNANKLTFDASWTPATLEAALRIANSQVFVRTAPVLG